MKFFYSASVMGYGVGRKWHKKYNFPNFPRVTQSLTYQPKTGLPFAIIKYGNSIWNKVSLHNIGFYEWLRRYKDNEFLKDIIVSIVGTETQIYIMTDELNNYNIRGIELNFSCPNVKSFNNKKIPESKHPIYLKLNHKQDPYDYNLNRVKEIRLNSVPSKYWGAWSGKFAQEKNWLKIKEWIYEGLKVSGCSFTNIDEIKKLEDFGCSSIGIGSVILTNPKLVVELDSYK